MAPIGLDEFSGMKEDYLSRPLVHQPGNRWEYSMSIDWAGQLVERVTGMSLNDYFLMHIFEPIGYQHVSHRTDVEGPGLSKTRLAAALPGLRNTARSLRCCSTTARMRRRGIRSKEMFTNQIKGHAGLRPPGRYISTHRNHQLSNSLPDL
ncbi:hypothetical protein GJ744_008771 [Endocarpon pusillum]|uniref:Beta-lactamase-related domain-containing protein n=1 Tax=Endocarpon pusillum TaxID=364733 RepID=A0A8H7E8S3_9EURO|nr:hypothetical protein GJ744_008771 [Endocarpon pusillum]